jgi:hypothetical protein
LNDDQYQQHDQDLERTCLVYVGGICNYVLVNDKLDKLGFDYYITLFFHYGLFQLSDYYFDYFLRDYIHSMLYFERDVDWNCVGRGYYEAVCMIPGMVLNHQVDSRMGNLYEKYGLNVVGFDFVWTV